MQNLEIGGWGIINCRKSRLTMGHRLSVHYIRVYEDRREITIPLRGKPIPTGRRGERPSGKGKNREKRAHLIGWHLWLILLSMNITVTIGACFVSPYPVLEAVVVEPILAFLMESHSLSSVEHFSTDLALLVSLQNARIWSPLNSLAIQLRRNSFIFCPIEKRLLIHFLRIFVTKSSSALAH